MTEARQDCQAFLVKHLEQGIQLAKPICLILHSEGSTGTSWQSLAAAACHGMPCSWTAVITCGHLPLERYQLSLDETEPANVSHATYTRLRRHALHSCTLVQLLGADSPQA